MVQIGKYYRRRRFEDRTSNGDYRALLPDIGRDAVRLQTALLRQRRPRVPRARYLSGGTRWGRVLIDVSMIGAALALLLVWVESWNRVL